MFKIDQFFYFFLILNILLGSAGCSKKKGLYYSRQPEHDIVSGDTQNEKNAEQSFHKTEEIILDLTDIPVPFYETKKVINRSEDDDTDGFAYLVKGTRNEIVQFYQDHLDMMGWQLTQQFIGSDESLLVFEMPFRSCAVFVHKEKDNEYIVTVFSKNNEYTKDIDVFTR